MSPPAPEAALKSLSMGADATRVTKVASRVRAAEDEKGFTLIEVVIALTVVLGAMASLAYVGTASLSDIAIAKSRRAATSLADQALEQVRALPYDTVAKGLDNADLASMSDPAITQIGSEYFYGGELIPRGDNLAVAPLVPHRGTITVDDLDFTVATYVTYYEPDTTGQTFRVSVVVSWLEHLRGSQLKRTEAQTVVYAGAACQAAANHPFPAPCQPYFYASGSTASGGIGVDVTSLGGADVTQTDLLLPHQSTNSTIEQSISLLSRVTSSGTTYRNAAGDQHGVLPTTVQAYADNDPSSANRPEYASASLGSSTATTTVAGSGGNGLVLGSSGGDSGTARSAVIANLTNTCPDLSSPPVNQTDARPCGTASSVLGSQLSVALDLAAASLGTATLATVTGATGGAYTKRVVSSGASVCAGTPTGSDGCVHAQARQDVQLMSLGARLSGLSGLPGFTSMVSASDVSTILRAEAGIGSAAPTVTRSGSVSYWNGAGYTTMSLTASSQQIPVAPVTITNPLNGATLTVTGDLRTGSTSIPACETVTWQGTDHCARASATAESAIVGTMRYVVTVGSSTVADLTLRVDLGALEVSASYVRSQEQ